MPNQDEIILKKIQELFNDNQDPNGNIWDVQDKLAELYDGLSFERSYALQEIFPRIPTGYKMSKRAILKAEKHSQETQEEWGGTEADGRRVNYVSLREALKNSTGIDVGREYTYPGKMSPQEFQESFSPNLCKSVGGASTQLAEYALLIDDSASSKFCDDAVGLKLFLEKGKPVATRLIKEAYRKFWKANSEISGYEELKNIQNFDEMREFLMGVASEIPLDDVSAYLESGYHKDKASDELKRNAARLKKEFGHDVSGFFISDKTWKKYVQPVLDKRKAKESKKKKSSGLKGTIEGLKNTPSTQRRGRVG